MSVIQMVSSTLLATLTPQQKSDLFPKLEAVQAVMTASHGKKGDVVKLVAADLRVSVQAVHNWVGEYKKGGCKALVDGRRKRGAARGLPQITKDWIFQEFLRLQREDSGTEIYKMIRERARLWWKTANPRYAIPGFVDPLPIGSRGYPEGLSEETIRRCGPDAYERALAHQGRKTASGLLPSIPDTRFGVGYLERIFFDDQMYDHYITEAGYERTMRPVGFNALDYLTGAFLDYHIRLRWWDDESDSHKTLTQREFVWFVIGLLSSVGYRTDAKGTKLVFEHGTANSWASAAGKLRTASGHHSFDDALYAFTDGHVTIDRSGKFNKATFPEMLFKPRSAGNFRYKAPIESMFRAVRTHGLLLPGATGRKADLAPEETAGLEREERWCLKLRNEFPAHLSEAVRSNNYSFMEYHTAHRWIYSMINGDPEHALKDWERCGFVLREWHWMEDAPDFWRPRSELAALPEHIQATFDNQLLRASKENPLLRTRRMSREEALRSREDDTYIRTLDPTIIHHLLPIEWATPVTVRKNREIVVKEPLIRGSEVLVYSTTLTNERGQRIHLSPGDELLCHLDPFRPDSLIVMDQKGIYIGTSARRPDDFLTNSEIVEDLLKSRAVLTADLDAEVRPAFQSVAERRADVRAHNKDLEIRNVTPGTGAPEKPARKPRGKAPSEMADDAIANIAAPDEATHTDDLDV